MKDPQREVVQLLRRSARPLSVEDIATALSEALGEVKTEADVDMLLHHAELAGAARLVRLEHHWTDNLWTAGALP